MEMAANLTVDICKFSTNVIVRLQVNGAAVLNLNEKLN